MTARMVVEYDGNVIKKIGVVLENGERWTAHDPNAAIFQREDGGWMVVWQNGEVGPFKSAASAQAVAREMRKKVGAAVTDLDAMIDTMIVRAKAGHMGMARLILERDAPVTASDREAIVAAVIRKAATGNRAATRLKAAHLERERRR
jgi:hypothetical protein